MCVCFTGLHNIISKHRRSTVASFSNELAANIQLISEWMFDVVWQPSTTLKIIHTTAAENPSGFFVSRSQKVINCHSNIYIILHNYLFITISHDTMKIAAIALITTVIATGVNGKLLRDPKTAVSKDRGLSASERRLAVSVRISSCATTNVLPSLVHDLTCHYFCLHSFSH